MIFLPNKFEIIVSAFRKTIESLILRNGIKSNYLYMLMLIIKAEALNSKKKEPTNLTEFINEILKVTYMKKKEANAKFSFLTEDIGNYIVNRKAVACLIFMLCRETENITVKKINKGILIISDINEITHIKTFLEKLNGFYLREIITNRVCVVLTPCKTNKTSVEINRDWFDLTDPLSMINCFLNYNKNT